MRHLYRGKRVDNGEWFLGNLATFKDGDCVIFDADDDTSPLCQVDPETVGQYIGINDINDKKIFEGDIVKGIAYSMEWIGVIVWIEEIASFGLYHGHDIACENCSILKRASKGMKDEFTAEIIGNIYDDPEMLKEVTK